jgi:hypothetical protein
MSKFRTAGGVAALGIGIAIATSACGSTKTVAVPGPTVTHTV